MPAVAGERGETASVRRLERAVESRIAIVAAYAVIGSALLWSRLLHLGHSFWNDEITMVAAYVRPGARDILTGPSINHELMALLSWAVSPLVGESEIAVRLLSVVPFLAGVVLVTAWLHTRLGPLSGVLFLFLATVSPMLLDITRQARGYGLAFCAMAVVIVAALEALRTGRAWLVAAMCVAGVLGAWTLPQVALAFLPTSAVLVLDRRTRIPAAIGAVASALLIAGFYAPHSGAVDNASQIPDGVQIGFPWMLTAPIDQILLPALIWIDGTALVAGVVWLPLVLLVAVIAAASPLVRAWGSALVLMVGPVTTVAVLWIEQSYVVPRYLSFLLVPLFVICATGASSILERIRSKPALARTAVCVVVIGVLAVHFVVVAPDVVALPREAHRDAADVVEAGPAGTPVYAYIRHAENLEFYLGRPVQEVGADDIQQRVCGAREPVFLVEQPFDHDPVHLPCSDRRGGEHHAFRQYARGGVMNVWLVPPAS
jgi:hypothetical protein